MIRNGPETIGKARHMLDIVKLSEELKTRLQIETDLNLSDRLMTRDLLEARAKELAARRDEELQRIEQWASQQKAMVKEIFSAMIGEIEADRQRNEGHLTRIQGKSMESDKPLESVEAPHLKAAE